MNWGWILQMAWRDSRHSRRRLILYMSSIVMGVAALVSVRSFSDNLLHSVEQQAKILLGADLAIRSNSPFDPEDEAFLQSIGGIQARQVSFSSMALFPTQQATRLVQVRALRGEFPFYGEFETEPASAARDFQSGKLALVDNILMLQYGVEVGDPIKIGNVTFEIKGRLLQIPGESVAFSEFAPRIYIPETFVEETGLVQLGSRVRFHAFFKLPVDFDADKLVEATDEERERLELSADTVSERKERFERQLNNLDRFLSLVGFIALVLGGIGVASSIHLYIRQRMETVAVLRCVGARPYASFAIYLVQAGLMGILGALGGALIGIGIQRLIPLILGNLIPLEIEQAVSWGAVGQGVLVGLGTALLFALIPLLPVRRISPLLTLRSDYENATGGKRDLLVIVAFGLVGLALLGFSLAYSSRWQVGLGFFVGLVVTLGLLTALAKVTMVITRRYFPSGWQYVWRQGLANLYRPHNQTVVLMLAVGLGAFFILTLYLTQVSLLDEVSSFGEEGRPNLIFFDIQTPQKDELRQIVDSMDMEVLQEVPIVTMRLASVKGIGVDELREDESYGGRRWALRREYRCTYRDELWDSETLLEGTFAGRNDEQIAEVSLEQGIAEDLDVKIGDSLTFDILGIPLEARVGSIRAVEWRNFQTNFFIVFPTGFLEEAPQFHVFVSRADTPEKSAALQRAAIQRFPNVSAVDLSLVIDTIDSILEKLTFVIRFMALFSIITGFVVLTGAIVSGRYQRMKECILLRTLGASRPQIRRILLIEYLFLGIFASITGIVLSLVASWAIVYFVFDAVFIPEFMAVVVVLGAVVFLTIAIGMSNSRGLLEHPPLEVLRAED
ncbi:MAG: ABC transporter permease [Acidobacteriota bacterium]|nr:MAG: ABC transporter permease [Acidobacteriota bacterium]